MYSVLRDFYCANVHFEPKLSKVVGEEGDYYFDAITEFKDKCTIVYIKNTQ